MTMGKKKKTQEQNQEIANRWVLGRSRAEQRRVMLGITELLPEPNTGYLSREKVHEFKLKKKKARKF